MPTPPTSLRQRRARRRGTELYERQVRPQVEAGNEGRIVAIDVDTGAFEVAENTLQACERLLARQPDAQIWCVRIGHLAVHRFGRRLPTGAVRLHASCP